MSKQKRTLWGNGLLGVRALQRLCLTALVFTALGCTKKSGKTEIWIYTSIYKDVIASMQVGLEKKFPDVQFQWFQSGSENVAARLNAELAAGKAQADLVMTSDPFWYLEAKKAGHLQPYTSPAAGLVPKEFVDTEGFFTTVRMPVAVIAYNSDAIKAAEAPKDWDALLDPKWKGKISMASPMESGTAVLVTTQLAKKKGWEFFEKMRTQDLLSAGGNSAVISRLETKERPVGIVLLENVLDARRRKSPVTPVYPASGAILVPSPIALLKSSKQSDLAKKVYDYLFSPEMQTAILQGRMYSPMLLAQAPDEAKPFQEVLATALPWNPALLEELFTQKDAIKEKFAKTLLN